MAKFQIDTGKADKTINTNNVWDRIVGVETSLAEIAIDGKKLLENSSILLTDVRGKVIKIPKGNYNLLSPLVLDGGGAVAGIAGVITNQSWIIQMEKGTILQSPANDYSIIIKNRADKVQIKDGIFQGANGIKIEESQACIVEGSDFKVEGNAISINGLGCHRITNNIISATNCIDFSSHGGDTVLMGNDYYPKNNGSALLFQNTSGDIKSDNEIYTISNGCTGIKVLTGAVTFNQLFLTNNAIYTDYNAKAIDFISSGAIKYTDITISNNTFWIDQLNTRAVPCFSIRGLINSSIESNKFYGSTSPDGLDVVIDLTSSQNNVISNNVFHDNTGTCLKLNSCYSNLITDNMFRLNSIKGDGTLSADVVLSSSDRNVISNNFHEKDNSKPNKTTVLELGSSDFNKIFGEWQSDNCKPITKGINTKVLFNLNDTTKFIDRVKTDYIYTKEFNTQDKITFQAPTGSFMEVTVANSQIIFSIMGGSEILRFSNNGLELFNQSKNLYMSNPNGQKVKISVDNNNQLVTTPV